MITGILASAQTCQMGSRSGSSTFRRDPSALRALSPRSFAIFNPIAPAAICAFSDCTSRSRHSACQRLPVDPSEYPEPIVMRRAAQERDVLAETRSAAATASCRGEIDEHAKIELVHLTDHLLDVPGADVDVVVDVDDRELGFGDEMLRRDDRRPRPVIHDAGRRFLGARAALRADFGHPGRTLFARLDLVLAAPARVRPGPRRCSPSSTIAAAATVHRNTRIRDPP